MKNRVSGIPTVQWYDMELRDLETQYRTIPGELAKLREGNDSNSKYQPSYHNFMKQNRN